MALLAHARSQGISLAPLQRVVVGGAACPAALMEAFAAFGVETIHAWGMTETSPLGAVNQPIAATFALPAEEQAAQRLKQGRPLFGVDLKIIAPDGSELARDGTAFGPLKIKGHWICDSYFRLDNSPSHDDQGWFDTGDVATIDGMGYVQIVDRAKDVIKSGGEWISSIELENLAIAHPAVFEAAAIARPSEKWGERPVVVVVLKPGQTATPDELKTFFQGRVAKWCEPDEVIVASEIPHTATGKILKTALRKLYGGAT
jgi:fatty-acyl-CoA synthase